MTCREKFDSLTKWYAKALVIEYYHKVKKKQKRRHTIAETATYFDMSSAYISEALSLMKYKKSIKHIHAREQALRIIRTLM